MIDIILLTYNRLEYLKKCFWSFRATVSIPRDDYRFIVVDNHSEDGTIEWVKSMYDKGLIDKLIIPDKNVGSAVGFNIGINSGTNSKYFVMLCDDMYLHRGWDSESLKLIKLFHNKIAIVSFFRSTMKQHIILGKLKDENGNLLAVKVRGQGLGINFIKREIYEKCGKFSILHDKLMGFWTTSFNRKVLETGYWFLLTSISYAINMDSLCSSLNEIETYVDGYNVFRRKLKYGVADHEIKELFKRQKEEIEQFKNKRRRYRC